MARPGTEKDNIGSSIIIPAESISSSLLMWSRLERGGEGGGVMRCTPWSVREKERERGTRVAKMEEKMSGSQPVRREREIMIEREESGVSRERGRKRLTWSST